MKPFLTVAFAFFNCVALIAQTYTLETVPNPKKNPSSHYVSNPDNILSASAVAKIDSMLVALEDSTTAQVAVVFVNSIGEQIPKDFATALFKKWGIGYDKKDNGLLMLFVKDKRRMEFETGFGLEGILPDAICKRIQTEKMVPYAKIGSYDKAVIEGVKAVSEIIMSPKSVKEVYDETKHTGAVAPTDPFLHEGEYTGLAVFFLFFLGIFRGIRAIFHGANPIKAEVNKQIGKRKGRFWRGVLAYGVVPVGVCVGLIIVQDTIHAELFHAFIAMYAYLCFLLWDSRKRRESAFDELYGTLSEPDRYVRHREIMKVGWLKAILFPIPFGWLYNEDKKRIDFLRNHPRTTPQGYELTKVAADKKASYLTDYQKEEEKLKTVEYDVWRNETHNVTEAIGYENLSEKSYERCDHCQSKAMSLASNEIIKAATRTAEGQGLNYYECKACGHQRQVEYTIAMLTLTATSLSNNSNSNSSSGSSSSSSDSSFGGGDSGGGGSGSDW